ncbi:MAG: ATP-binding protein [Oscillospiraceae bacterium]|nr:ATP-binding protein [Oscillospiraceae bacterium]
MSASHNNKAAPNHNRIELRFRGLNIAFFVALAVIMVLVVNFMFTAITQTASHDYARFYSTETVNILNIYLNREIALAAKAARSIPLVEWFTDELNGEKKAAAYEELIHYTDMLFNANLYFVIDDSLNEYSIDEGASFHEFVPFDVIRPDIEYDQWYYRCVTSEYDYTLNIDIDKVTHQRRLWINHKVTRGGELLGVFCSSLLFDAVIDDLFSQYDPGNVRGIVMNEAGIIQMDSALMGGDDSELYENTLHIRDVSADPAFLSAIDRHLDRNGRYFTSRDAPVVFELGRDEYSFASLAPVANTNWTVVTFFNSDALFNMAMLWPLLFAMLAALIAYTFIVTLLSRKLIFTPLQRLIQSVARTEVTKNGRIYGCELQNEFGEVSRTIQNARDKLSDQNKELLTAMRNAEKASEVKSLFLANMSHEIRTPMNSIMGFAELALDSPVTPRVRDYLGKITDSTKWLLHIINDILDISKIEAGRMELENVPFRLQEVFSRCQSVILPAINEKGLDLRVYAEPLAGKKLVGDPVRLYQVLINLLSNAVKFTNTGTVSFSSRVKAADAGSATVYFEVGDTGIGMSAEQIERIFEPFMQADSSTTRDYGGTGLGLAIVKSIVNLMGGTLAVESAPGTGSTFSFEILFKTADAGSEPSARTELAPLARPYFDSLVLVCDDNPLNREVICEHLARVGIRAVTAENGKEGVEAVQKRIDRGEPPFDLIFMDMFMPVMDGTEAASKILALGTGTPVAAMTANIMAGELERYRRQGMPDCLGKPFTAQELWRLLLKYLTPVSGDAPAEEPEESDDLQWRLRVNFVKNNQSIHSGITEAVAAGDIKLAHRLAHTLKGSAGLIGKTGLRNAAEEVEALLKDGTVSVWEGKMNRLKAELTPVLEELRPLLEEPEARQAPASPALPAAQVQALFEKLGVMLQNINPECVMLLDELRAVPGTELLVRQVENYDFEAASGTLSELKEKWV